jgi:hypothetical protein
MLVRVICRQEGTESVGRVRAWWEARRARKAAISELLATSEPPSRLDRLDGITPMKSAGSAGSPAAADKPAATPPDTAITVNCPDTTLKKRTDATHPGGAAP